MKLGDSNTRHCSKHEFESFSRGNLFEICLKRGWAGLTERAMALCKMVNHRQWGSQHPLRQFKGLPSEMMTRLDKRDIPWERYYDMTSQVMCVLSLDTSTAMTQPLVQ